VKALLIILAALAVLDPWLALAVVVAACAGLGLLIIRAANGRVYQYPPTCWRSA
jgi:hypothetical protein